MSNERISLKIQNLFTFLINGADRYLITQHFVLLQLDCMCSRHLSDINLMIHKKKELNDLKVTLMTVKEVKGHIEG